jgi:hypothetical protein
VRQIDRLVAVGASAASALTSQEAWIHRRVESITFPFPDRPVYRRHVSIDFTIPAGLDAAAHERGAPGPTRPPRYYVPLSLVKRWPPLPRLDLRDEAGRPMPFLTARQNAILDSVALQGVALEASGSISDDLQRTIAKVAAAGSRADRAAALEDILRAPPDSDQTREATAHRSVIASRGFCALGQALIENSLLWLRIEGWPEDREIVKFSYDVPLERKQFGEWSRPSFGLEPFVFEFEVPHLGTTSSYHCNIVAPTPLEVVRGALALFEPSAHAAAPAALAGQVRHSVDSVRPRPRSQLIELYAGVAESQAKFYASGDRTGLQGKLWVALLIQSEGLLGGALGAGVAALAILLSFTALLSATVQLPEAAAPVLLISPGVLGYLLVRPSEHVFVGGFLVALRRVVIGSGVPPVLGAAVLSLSEGHATALEYIAFSALTLIEAVLLWLIWRAYAAGREWREAFAVHPDASLL